MNPMPHLCEHGVQLADDTVSCLPCANRMLHDLRDENDTLMRLAHDLYDAGHAHDKNESERKLGQVIERARPFFVKYRGLPKSNEPEREI